jgi:hypothetical protein
VTGAEQLRAHETMHDACQYRRIYSSCCLPLIKIAGAKKFIGRRASDNGVAHKKSSA